MVTAEDILKEKSQDMISVGPDVTVWEAIRVMTVHHIEAILVKENEKYVGIWTERDLLHLMAKDEFNPNAALIKDFMVKNLCCASHNTPVYKIQDMILGKRCRHILIQKDNNHIGILSAGDITRANLNEKSKQLKSVSWDYYENWRWKKK
jgi:signal-transduction protein with cAMP-binding, CBS, and nucleotidyltransferase domain